MQLALLFPLVFALLTMHAAAILRDGRVGRGGGRRGGERSHIPAAAALLLQIRLFQDR